MFASAIFWRLVRYGTVGIASNIAGYALYVSMTYLGLGPKLTMTILYVVGATFGYLGNRQWAFFHTGSMVRSSAGYLIAHAVGYVINFVILHTFVDLMGYPHQIVQGLAIFVVAGYLFVALNFIVFKAEKAREMAS